MGGNTLVEIALVAKTLYDLTDNRISLVNRMGAYNLRKNLTWKSYLERMVALEKMYEKKLIDLITQTEYASALNVKGFGPRIVGGLIMHLIATERIYHKTKKDKNKNPKYLGTRFLNELRSFNSFQSLNHYAGQHLRCRNCGFSQKDCFVKVTKTMVNKKTYTGCGKCKEVGLEIAKLRKGKPIDWNEGFRKWLLGIRTSLFRSSAKDAPYQIIYTQNLQKSMGNPDRADWTELHHKNHAKRLMIRQLLKDFYNNYMRK